MEQVVKFRVLVDRKENEDIFRDIEMLGSHTFVELHSAIQEAFAFDNSQMASFYISDENWERGQEIALMDMGLPGAKPEETPLIMSEEPIAQHVVTQGHKQFIYVFDFFLMWTFIIEVISVDPLKSVSSDYPNVSLSYGEAPDQYSKEPDTDFGGTMDMDNPFDDEDSPYDDALN